MKRIIICLGLLSLLFINSSIHAKTGTRVFTQDIYPKIELLLQVNKTFKITFSCLGNGGDIVWYDAKDKDSFKFRLTERQLPALVNSLEITPTKANLSNVLFILQKGGTPCIIKLKSTNEPVNYNRAFLESSIDIDTDKWAKKREEQKNDVNASPPFKINNGMYSANQEISNIDPITLQIGKTTKVIFENSINFFTLPNTSKIKANISISDSKILELSPLTSDTRADLFVSAGEGLFYLKTEEILDYTYFEKNIVRAGIPPNHLEPVIIYE